MILLEIYISYHQMIGDVKWKECTYKDFPFKLVEGIGLRDLQIHKGKALYEVEKKNRQNCDLNDNFEEF